MDIAIVVLILFITLLTILKFSKNLKVVALLLVIIFITSTVFICIKNPTMHKPFSIDIIEYLIKINDDGSMTTTKQVTKTVIDKQPAKEENK